MKMTFKDPDNKQIRDSGMALTLICLIIAFFWFEKHLFLLITMAFLVVTMTIPVILKPFAFIWINFSHYIGIVISKVLLTVIFFGLVIPVGAILKMIGKDSMYTRKWKDGNSTSVMIKRDHIYTSKDLSNPFGVCFKKGYGQKESWNSSKTYGSTLKKEKKSG